MNSRIKELEDIRDRAVAELVLWQDSPIEEMRELNYLKRELKGEFMNDPTKVLKDLVEQLNGIGIPDWHGAEGLDLTDARRIVESEAPNCLFELELKLNSNDETARIEIAGILENLAIRIREGGWDTSFENEERYVLGDQPSCGMVGASGMARIVEKE